MSWQNLTLNIQCIQASPTAELNLTGFVFRIFLKPRRKFFMLHAHSYRYAKFSIGGAPDTTSPPPIIITKRQEKAFYFFTPLVKDQWNYVLKYAISFLLLWIMVK